MPDVSENVEKAMELVKTMSVIELSEFSKSLQDEFGVTAAAPVAAAAPAAGGGGEVAEAEQTEFAVELSAIGDKKIQVIKAVREITGLGLKEAKEVVDKAPSNVKEGIPKDEAESIQKKLMEAGATAEIK